MTNKAQFSSALRQRDAKIVRRLRKTSFNLEALGAKYGLTRQRIQQIVERVLTHYPAIPVCIFGLVRIAASNSFRLRVAFCP